VKDILLVYTPIWETLAEALSRLVSAGSTVQEAKFDLCRAIADGAIEIRLLLAEDPKRHLSASAVSSEGLDVPARILPGDIDWRQSRPIKPWPLAEKRLDEPTLVYSSRVRQHVERSIDTVQVRSLKVSRLIGTPPSAAPKPASAPPIPKSRSGAKSQGIKNAICELWPEGRPDNLTGKQRDNDILAWFARQGHTPPDPRTIQRAIRSMGSERKDH
jgi:hypothetical protein